MNKYSIRMDQHGILGCDMGLLGDEGEGGCMGDQRDYRIGIQVILGFDVFARGG